MIARNPKAASLALLVALVFGTATRSRAADFSYASLDTVLTRHVRDGRVDYGALARDPGPLRRFLAASAEANPAGWSRQERIAFWVNVYNARVLDGVIRRPGLKSVLDVGKVLGVPTLGFFRERGCTAGRDLSLNDIEHGILRAEFHEPRIHFVLNCASASCPALPARALQAATLDSTLEAAARTFLLDRSKNQITPGPELKLSSIFKWYRSDFETGAGSLQTFVLRYGKGAEGVRANAPIKFLRYDWSLNGDW